MDSRPKRQDGIATATDAAVASGNPLPKAAARNVFARDVARDGGPRDEPPAIVFLRGALRDHPDMAVEVVAAALKTAPDLVDDIQLLATRLAPRQAADIQRLVDDHRRGIKTQ